MLICLLTSSYDQMTLFSPLPLRMPGRCDPKAAADHSERERAAGPAEAAEGSVLFCLANALSGETQRL